MAKDNRASAEQQPQSAFLRMWHYRPDVPIKTAPYFITRPSLSQMIAWTYRQWLFVTERSILLIITTLSFLFLQKERPSRYVAL